jgi:hypothetical protein
MRTFQIGRPPLIFPHHRGGDFLAWRMRGRTARGLHLMGCPAEQGRGVVSLVRSGELFFCLSIFLVSGASILRTRFRFPSRFHLSIPIFITVAPVSRCCGLYLAVGGTA